MDQRTHKTLESVGKKVEFWESPDGSRVMLLPYGGRILGLMPPEDSENFLWTNPALEFEASAAALFQSSEWHNTGGDRTWLAPELDIFFPNYPNTSVHSAPIQLDASNYDLIRGENSIGMAKTMTVHMARASEDLHVRLIKMLAPSPHPLRNDHKWQQLQCLQYAGYTLNTTLELVGDSVQSKSRIGLWNLLQLPHGGDMLIPTFCRCEPRVIFGDIASENLEISDHLVRFRCRFAGEHKIATKAMTSTGRAGYIYRTVDQWALVIRNFIVNPSGTYVDCPKTDPGDLGYVFQAVSVDSVLGQFCELEYHAPAIGGDTGYVRSDDISQLWAFRGSLEEVRAVATMLLSPHA